MIFGGRRKSDEAQSKTTDNDPEATATMPAVPVSPATHNFEAVLGAETTVEGALECQGNIRLDGKFTGKLAITGNVLVGETAVVEANIDANNVSIAGTVRGNVSGKRVQLLRTGKVWGDIAAASLTTEDGAFIDGKVTMPAQQQPTEPVDLEEPTFIPPPTDEPAPPATIEEASEDIIEAELENEDEDD